MKGLREARAAPERTAGDGAHNNRTAPGETGDVRIRGNGTAPATGTSAVCSLRRWSGVNDRRYHKSHDAGAATGITAGRDPRDTGTGADNADGGGADGEGADDTSAADGYIGKTQGTSSPTLHLTARK